MNINIPTVKTLPHLPDFDIIAPVIRKFFFPSFRTFRQNEKIAGEQKIENEISNKTVFPTIPDHPMLPKTPPIACLQSLKVLFSVLQRSPETSSDVIEIDSVTIFRYFSGNCHSMGSR